MAEIFLTLLFFSGVEGDDWYNPKWAIVIAIAAILFARQLWSMDKWLGLAVGYSLLNGTWFSLTNYSYTHSINDLTQGILSMAGVKAMTALVATIYIAKNLPVKKVHMRWLGFFACAWLTAAGIAGFYYKGPDLNVSLSATLCALLVPYWLDESPGFAWLMATGFALTNQSARIGALAALFSVSVYCFAKIKSKVTKSILVSGWLIIFGTGVYGVSTDKISLHGRKEMWSATIKAAVQYPERLVTGFGLGSYLSYGQNIQKMTDHEFEGGKGYPITLHNDYLQLIFELGWIGFALWLAAYARLVWFSRREPWLLAFWASLAVSCIGNFPHHMGLDALVIAISAKFALEADPDLTAWSKYRRGYPKYFESPAIVTKAKIELLRFHPIAAIWSKLQKRPLKT